MIRPWKRTMVTMTCNRPVSLVQRICPDALVCTLLPSDESVHIFFNPYLVVLFVPRVAVVSGPISRTTVFPVNCAHGACVSRARARASGVYPFLL